MIRRRTAPEYHHDPEWRCPECKDRSAKIIPDLNDFDYSGTHCSHGLSGTHFPAGWGAPICSACGCDIEDAELVEDAYEQEESGRHYMRYQDD